MSLIDKTLRSKKGTILELAFAFPFIIILAFTLISVAQIYYTQNLLRNTVTDTATKLSVLFRNEFFSPASHRTEAEFISLMKAAIKNENEISRLKFNFFDNVDGFAITFEDLGAGAALNTYDGALRLYLRPGLGQADITYDPSTGTGAIPQAIQDNCADQETTMNFNEFMAKVRFKMPVTLNIFNANFNYVLDVESNTILGQLDQETICTAMGL